jgi:hypothetical protein
MNVNNVGSALTGDLFDGCLVVSAVERVSPNRTQPLFESRWRHPIQLPIEPIRHLHGVVFPDGLTGTDENGRVEPVGLRLRGDEFPGPRGVPGGTGPPVLYDVQHADRIG